MRLILYFAAAVMYWAAGAAVNCLEPANETQTAPWSPQLPLARLEGPQSPIFRLALLGARVVFRGNLSGILRLPRVLNERDLFSFFFFLRG